MTQPPPSERRHSRREVACFPAYVEHDASKKEVTLIADLATTGALLLVRGAHDFTAGEGVRLELHIEAEKMRGVAGRVVRIEPLPKQRVSVWTHQVAVEFESPIELAPDEQRMIREQCERLGLRR
jgi:hypothetical protein